MSFTWAREDVAKLSLLRPVRVGHRGQEAPGSPSPTASQVLVFKDPAFRSARCSAKSWRHAGPCRHRALSLPTTGDTTWRTPLFRQTPLAPVLRWATTEIWSMPPPCHPRLATWGCHPLPSPATTDSDISALLARCRRFHLEQALDLGWPTVRGVCLTFMDENTLMRAATCAGAPAIARAFDRGWVVASPKRPH